MLSLFNVMVFIHVVCAIIWIGSAVVLEILEFEATHVSKRERLRATLTRTSWFGGHVFGPAAILTILSGIAAVAVGRPTFEQAWVIIALVAVVLVAALGGGVVGRTSAQLAARLDDKATNEDAVEQGLINIRWAVYLDLAILFFILFDMVIRPTTFDPAFLLISGIYFALVIVGIIVSSRRHERVLA